MLTARLGALPAWVVPRLEQEEDVERLGALLVAAAKVDVGADLERLFTT